MSFYTCFCRSYLPIGKFDASRPQIWPKPTFILLQQYLGYQLSMLVIKHNQGVINAIENGISKS